MHQATAYADCRPTIAHNCKLVGAHIYGESAANGQVSMCMLGVRTIFEAYAGRSEVAVAALVVVVVRGTGGVVSGHIRDT